MHTHVGNYSIDIMCHLVSYYFDGTELEICEVGIIHVEECLKKGIREGKVSRKDPHDSTIVYEGYWAIIR